MGKIVVATQKLLVERGYAGTTMAAIAAEAGIKSASIYRYFPNKKAILWELAELFIAAQDQAIHQCIAASHGGAPWRMVLSGYLQGLRENLVQEAWITPAQLGFRSDPALKESHEKILTLFNERFAGLLQTMGKKLTAQEAGRAAKMLVLCIDSYMMAIDRTAAAEQAPLQKYFEELVFRYLEPYLEGNG